MPSTPHSFLQIHPKDNVLVALQNLTKGANIIHHNQQFILATDVAAKHKFTMEHLEPGAPIYMYGVLVGKTVEKIPQGAAITTKNIRHAADEFELGQRNLNWNKPDVSKWAGKQFMGYHRADGSVGTANYWLVIPLVFCENRNVEVLKDALVDKLGYKKAQAFDHDVDNLIRLYQTGQSIEDILTADISGTSAGKGHSKLFPNIDGIKFLTHEMGCGGTRTDSDSLCGLLAGYITHPNVAGATVLSLGCQHSQASILKEEVLKRSPAFNKPFIVLEQQKEGTENKLLQKAIKHTFAALIEANKTQREPAPISKLCIGLECGGSDGFSGISANPALGYVSDVMVTLGGSVILSEFPELCGVEQELSDRCADDQIAQKFISLMRLYNKRAEESGSGFFANPSPGNIRDGLITDAIKSAGAAKKGGSSPITDVLDYPEKVSKPGLNLLCTPGNDVESTTAEVAAGANIVLFTTGLGTPTGNPIAPVIKVSTNSTIYNRMNDIIDINCGTIIEGTETIEQAAERILNLVLDIASGNIAAKSELLGQDDFIPWKRGVSL